MITGSATNSVLQRCSDGEMRGRVISFYIMVFIGVAALGGQFMGYLADVRSTPFSLCIGGAACVLVAIVLTAFPGLTRTAVTCEENRPGRFEQAI
jgi:hypothetical protein